MRNRLAYAQHRQLSSSEDVQERCGVQEKVLKGYQYLEQFLVLVLLAPLVIVTLHATVGFLVFDRRGDG